MKLVFQRDQHSGGLMGKVTLSLDVKAELTAAEQEYIRKYKMGKEILYYKEKVDVSGIEMMGALVQLGRSIADQMNYPFLDSRLEARRVIGWWKD